MVRFQKLIRNLFLTLYGHNVHRQQRKLSKFLMRYQHFASHAYCRAAGQQGQFPRWRCSGKTLSVCSVLRCPDLWLLCSVSFVHSLEKTHHAWCVFSKSCSKHEKRTVGSARETWTVAAADGESFVSVRWKMHFFLNFETAPFFCVYPVFSSSCRAFN